MHVRQRLLFTLFLVTTLVAVLHSLALTFFFYWQLWWFDILMHFLGGMVVGLLSIAVCVVVQGDREPVFTRKTLLGAVFLGVVVVGIGWELFELRFGIYEATNYRADTSLDLVMDVIGAFVVYAYIVRSRMITLLQ